MAASEPRLVQKAGIISPFHELMPVEGSQPSLSENTSMSRSAIQKTGMELPISASIVANVSINVYCFTAAHTPMIMPNTVASSMAVPAILSVVGKATFIISITGILEL